MGKGSGPRRYISTQKRTGAAIADVLPEGPDRRRQDPLAVKAIDLVNMIYRKRKNGLVLWIVPTTQIYRQTIQNLKDRDHPYRQHLDLASGGRTLILEKTDRFSPQDMRENLVVLMLMLPSANRKTKETLKVFKDSGGFQDFFPPEDDIKAQEAAQTLPESGHLREGKRLLGQADQDFTGQHAQDAFAADHP